MWRKTRKPNGLCYGVDLNRNFDSNWGGIGSSDKICAYDYSGPEVNSEPEAKYWSEYLSKSIPENNVKVFLSLHSFSQLIMFPYGATSEHVRYVYCSIMFNSILNNFLQYLFYISSVIMMF